MARSSSPPVPSLPGPYGPVQPRPKGRWTIGLIGRRKSVRVAALGEALGTEEAIGSYAVVATAGLKRTSNTKFGDHAIALVTPRRLVVLAVNYQPRFALNPVVLLASAIAHWISPVRRPYVVFEAPLPQVQAHHRDRAGGIDVDVTVPEGSWVLRFQTGEEAVAFMRILGQSR